MEYHGLKVLCEGWQAYIFDERIASMQRNQCRVSRTMHIETASRAAAVIKRRGILSRLASINLGLLLVSFWCGEGSAAESARAAPAVPTAKLLFKSNFGPGVKLGDPSGGGKRDTYRPLIGTDRETGYTWPGDRFGIQFLWNAADCAGTTYCPPHPQRLC